MSLVIKFIGVPVCQTKNTDIERVLCSLWWCPCLSKWCNVKGRHSRNTYKITKLHVHVCQSSLLYWIISLASSLHKLTAMTFYLLIVALSVLARTVCVCLSDTWCHGWCCRIRGNGRWGNSWYNKVKALLIWSSTNQHIDLFIYLVTMH